MTEVEFGATVDEINESRGANKYRKTEFLNTEPGEHRIRILEPMETKKYTHYIGWVYVQCLEDECPICANNKKILYEHPEDFREVKGWNPRKARFYINVLDKTPTRVCTKCATEKRDTSDTCSACGSPMGEMKPLGKVKVLSMGKELIEEIKTISRAVRNEQDERIDIRMYDFLLDIKGAKLDKKTKAIQKWYPGKEAYEDLGEQQLFPLDEIAVKLSPEEMLDVFNGASLKDVFALRRAKKEVLNVAEVLNENVQDDIASAVDSLFK